MEQAHENYPSRILHQLRTQPMENIDRVFEYFFGGQLTPRTRAGNRALRVERPRHAGSWAQFMGRSGFYYRAAWCMGRLRQRQNKLAEAIEFYQRAGLLPETFDDIQKCSFLLDYGLASMLSSATDPREETLRTPLSCSSERRRSRSISMII